MEYGTTTRTNRIITTTTTTATATSNNEFFSLEDEIGEISALLDNSAAKHRISVRPTRSKRSPCIAETKAKQEKEATIRELIETEEEFVRDLKYLISNYIRWTDEGTETGKSLAKHSQFLFGGIQDIYEFHKTVLLEGMKYYADQPNQIGRSFTRLERDFDKHAAYIDRMESIQEFLNDHPSISEAFYNRSIELNDTGRTLIDYVRLPSQRLNDYSLLLSDLIKISKQIGEPTNDLEKGLELVNWIPCKSRDLKFIQSIEGFGDTRAGRILRHDWFRLNVGGREKERYCFLFKNKLLVTKVRRISPDRSVFILKDILQLPELQLVEIENSGGEGDAKEQGSFGLLDKEGSLFVFQSEPAIANSWAKDVQEFTSTKPQSDEPEVKKGRVIKEVAESVTINGVEITDVTSINEDRSYSTEKQVDITKTHRIIDIPIQVESSDDTSVSDRIITIENEKNSSKVDVIEIEQINVSVKESIIDEIEEGEIDEDNEVSVGVKISSLTTEENNIKRNIVNIHKEADENKDTVHVEVKAETVSESKRLEKLVSVEQSQSLERSVNDNETLEEQKEIESEVQNTYSEISRPQTQQVENNVVKPSSELSEVSQSQVSDTAGTKSTAGRETQTSTVSETKSSTVSETKSSAVSETKSSVVSETKSSAVSESTVSVAAEVLEPKSTPVSKVKVSSVLVEESEAPEQKASGTPEQKTSATPQSKESATPELKPSAQPEQKTSAVPESKKSTVSEQKVSAVPEQKASAVPEQKASAVPEQKASAVPEQKASAVPEQSESAAPESKDHTAPERKASAVPQSKLSAVPESKPSEVPESKPSAVSESKPSVVPEPKESAVPERKDSIVSKRKDSAASESKLPATPERKASVRGSKASSPDHQVRPSKSTSSANLIRMDSTCSNDAEKPQFTLNVKSVEVEPGENAVLVVETSSSSPSIVTWLKENKPLEDKLADRVKIVSKENAHTLTLLNCTDDDSGLYTAKCSSQHGTTCSSGFINVHEFTPEERQQKALERQPNFIVKMKDTELLQDTTISFVVKCTGDPTPTLKFYKDNVLLVDDDRIYVGKSGDLTELTIRNIGESDAGNYSCTAKNKYGEATTSGNLTVTDEKTMFPGLSGNLLEPGEEPEFSWYRDGVKFSPEDKFKVLFKDDEDSLALVFQHVRPEDAGLYTCVASTSSGRISCSAELTVQGAIHQLLREPEAPVITAELTDTEVSTGGSAMLELKVTGFPKPDVSWFKDGVEIQAGGKYRFLYEDDESIALIIKGVDTTDAGQYHVVAKNDLGEATTTGRLQVNSPPKFKAKMQDTACMTDEAFSMSVTVHGSPEPQVKWYKDGQLIIESERIQMRREENGVFTLTFEKITLEDGGAYSVVASNAIGQMSEFWNLVANSKARFTKTIESEIHIKETETTEISVEVYGNPEPEVRWSIGGKEVGRGTTYKYKATSRTDEKITVKCENPFGGDECSGQIKVLRGSKIKDGLKNATVEYDGVAEFTVKVDEFPKGKVSWFIDGIEIDGKKYEKVDEGDTHTIKIKGVTASANVKVRAENVYGYDEQEARLDVIRKPTITRPLEESYTEVEQKTLKLSVDVLANPEPVVNWYHNGEKVDADARIKIHREGTETWSLTFNVLLPSDSGDWTVKSVNQAGEAESKTVVIVEGKPEFEKKLIETVECVESESVAFEVKVKGAPAPVIQWSLNNEEVTVTKRTSIETNTSRSTTTSKLVINSTLLEDAGVVTCVARNEHGSCETTSTLKVEKSGPKLTIDTSPRIVEAGKELKLTATAADGATIQWAVKGSKEKAKGGEFKLKPEKSCVVTVIADDGKKEERLEIPVRVMSRPKITGLSDVACGPGETITLSPKVESEPDGLEVAWYKGDDKVKDCKDNDYSLTLSNVSLADAGKYTLVAKNLVGETSLSAKLNVMVEPPSFTRGLSDLKLREGDALSLRVRVIGIPEPKVTWELDGKIITVEGKEGSYEIVKESIQLDQFGSYTVKAENVAGSATTSGKISLIEEKPLVTKGPERSKTVDETEPFTLTATVTGSPAPTIQWLKNGEPIKLEPGRVEVSSAPGGIQKLVVASSDKADEGVYTLEATNPISSVKSSPSQVNVVPAPIPPTVKITAPEEAELGSEIVLKLEIGGQPEPKVTLYENDKQIEPIKVSRDKNGTTANYTVKVPSRGEAVNYSAKAVSATGKGNDQADIKLVAPPAAPVIIESLPAEKSAVDGTALKLTSIVSGSPLPNIQWLRDNVPIPCLTNEVNGKLLTSVILDGVGAADGGVYTLVAENPSGTEKQKCQVSVLGKVDDSKPMAAPSFTSALPENILISEGEELVLLVGVGGNPMPEVQWGRLSDSGDKDSTKGKASAPAKVDDGARPSAKVSDDLDKDAQRAALDDGKKSDLGEASKAAPGDGAGVGPGTKADVADADQGADLSKAELGDGDKTAPQVGDATKAVVEGSGASGASQPDDSTDASKGKKKAAVSDTASSEKALSSPTKPSVNDEPRLEPLRSVFGPEAKVDETFDGKNAILRVPGMRHSYEGPVTVQLTNPLGSATGTVNVGVRKVYSPAKITDKFNDIHQIRGGDARFTAKITGDPRPELEWRFNGKPLPKDNQKYGTKWDGKTGSLTVFNVGDADLGKYTLIARNIEGSDECSGVLKEITGSSVPPASTAEKGEKPYFLKKIADTEFYEGMTVKFTACVGGTPEPDFHWFKDDLRLYPGGRVSIENNENGLLRLIIANTGPQDLGVYTLKIFNKYGEDQCKAQCTIEDFHVGGSSSDATKTAAKPVGPPNPLPDKPIISSMTDRHLTLSWKPALRTHIDYPVTYTVEMCDAKLNDWFTLRSGIKGCSTEVRNLEPGKDYKFRVRVENRIGISEPSPYAQTLRYKFDWKPTPWTPPSGDYDLNRPPHPGFTHAPKFLNTNTEQYGVPGAGIGIEWWLYGYPKPSVTFFYNGNELSNTDHVFDSNGRVVLYIDKLSESRQGWYECVGVNEHGEDRYRIHVLIGEHPKWIIRLQETHILERRDGKLSGVVTARPKPDLKWYKDWQTLGESSRIKFTVLETETGTYRVSCSLTDAILKDHGLYSCAASNVVGTASSSGNVNIEEAEEEWRFKSYNKRLSPISLRSKPIRDFYAFGDEIGRGTQGINRHATGLHNGVAVAVKSMESGDAVKREWMRNEFGIHSELFHPGISRVSDGYQDERGVHIVTDICTGGDLVSNCISRGGFSEHQVSDYMRQLLLSLDYLHNNKSVAHLGINAFDLLFSHEDSDTLKLVDFGLARRITSRLEKLDYGHPEFASPEILNGEGAGYSADLWSVGIVTYLLLNGTTPFVGENDLETINNVKNGKWELWNKNISESGQDFIRNLLTYDPRGRLDVRRALEHPWISRYFANSEKKISSSLVTYKSSLTKWYENASCRNTYRRNPWSGAYTHPSKMIYPPGEIDLDSFGNSRDPKGYQFGVPNYPRPDLNVDVGVVKSESHYQNGPDTYLLQLRDSGFPARLRQYMKVAASRSPSFALQLKSQAYDRNNPIIRERRRFTDVMDEEVKDELTQGKEWRGEPRRLRHEVGLHLDTSAQADAIVSLHKDGVPAFIREGPSAIIKASIGDSIIIQCIVDGSPEPIVQWFKSDIVLGNTHRIDPTATHLEIKNVNETDFGVYKLAARNSAGSSTMKFRIVLGHYSKSTTTDTDYGIETNKLEATEESADFTELLRDGNFGLWALGTISSSQGNIVKRLSTPVPELNLQTSLAHTGILRLKSLINNNNNLYFVYNESTANNYIKLTDKYIQDGVYNEYDISNAVLQILSVLSYVQWRGLQLLNLSLDNILTDDHGNVKIFDTSSITRVAKIGSILPIPNIITQFTPPELLAGENTYLTTDVWSVGCLVYTLLSGCWPFAGEDDKQTKGNIQFVRYRFEPLYVNSTPEATRFLMMIFKKCPLKRPTIEEVLDSRWLATQDSMVRKRSSASFKSLGLEKLITSSSFSIRT